MKKQPKVLITGSTGFLGIAICRHLLAEGYALRCHFRRVSQLNILKAQLQVKDDAHAPIEYIRQDLAHATTAELHTMIEGCDTVVHNAALVRDWGTLKKICAINVVVTRRIVEIALALNIKRFVYVSSIAVHGLKNAEHITEQGPYNRLYNVYAISKMKAERVIRDIFTQEQKNNFVIIRPASIYGLSDETTYHRIFRAIENRILPYIGTTHGLIPLVHKSDVARSVSCALTAPEQALGEAYNITSGEVVEFGELFRYIASQLNVRPPALVLPAVVLILIALLTNGVRFVFHLPCAPLVTMFRIRSMMSRRKFDTTKARVLLDFIPQVQWKEGFAESIDEYHREQG